MMLLPFIKFSSGTQGKRKKIKDVVVFGETGVGNSSLINLTAGRTVSQTSSAAGCTFSYQRHLLRLDNQSFVIWDTAGLDEGSHGSVPAEKLEAHFRQLLHDLSKAGGVDLLIYCVRGTQVQPALLTNYHLFYSAICRKKVPIAIVITGLENQDSNINTWWLKNEERFSALQMHFDDYACVTTPQSSAEISALEERRGVSRKALIKLITNNCRTEQWIPAEHSWADTAFLDVRAILSSKNESKVRAANAIICDVSRQAFPPPGCTEPSITFQTPITLYTFLTRLVSPRSLVPVADEVLQRKLPFNVSIKCTPEHIFRVDQVPQREISHGKKKEKTKNLVVKRGADLLVFCVEKGNESCRDVKEQWEYFNLTYGGDLSPQIIVVIGAMTQQLAEDWWNKDVLNGSVTRPGDASVAYWPAGDAIAEIDAKARLRDIIDVRCIDCSKANLAGDRQIFSHRTADEPDADSDVLTRWGVWGDIATETKATIESDVPDLYK